MADGISSSGDPSHATTRDQGSFSATLMGLKHRGCCVLVTGQVDERARAAQSRRLFGQTDEPRKRVLTLIEGSPCRTNQYLPTGITPAHSSVTTLDYTEEARDITVVTSSPSQPTAIDLGSGETASLSGLSAVLCDPLRDAIQADTRRPGELRLGIATLGTLIDIDGLSVTQTLIRTIRSDILDSHGMGHFHYPGEPDSDTIAALRPMIDIHVELRVLDGVLEHRWKLLETGHSTDWLPMGP